MDIDAFFPNEDLFYSLDGNDKMNFVGAGHNAWQNKDEYKFAPKAQYDFEPDETYAQLGGSGMGADTVYSPNYLNAYGGENPNTWSDLRKKNREGHGTRKYLDNLSPEDLKDCKKLDAVLSAIKTEIVNNNRTALESKAQARVMKGYNEGLGKAKGEIERIMKSLNCEIKGEEEFMDTLAEINKGTKGSNVVLYGGIAVAAIGLGIVLYRALKK